MTEPAPIPAFQSCRMPRCSGTACPRRTYPKIGRSVKASRPFRSRRRRAVSHPHRCWKPRSRALFPRALLRCRVSPCLRPAWCRPKSRACRPPVADEVAPSGACDAALPLLSPEGSLAEGAGPAGLAPARPPEAEGEVSLLLAADEGWLPGAVALVEGCDGELEVAVEDDPGWLAAVPLVSGRAPEGAEVDER